MDKANVEQFGLVLERSIVGWVGQTAQEVQAERYRCVIGPSAAMQEVLRPARTVAATHTTVLLLGGSETGKKAIAWLTHQWSPCAGRLFLLINWAALPSL